MTQALDFFYRNAIVSLVVVAVVAALSAYIGLGTVSAFLFMLLGLLVVLWDAHTDSHIPPAPTLT